MDGFGSQFEAFSLFHAVVVGLCVAVIAAACAWGRRLRGADRGDGGRREVRFAVAVGWSIVGWQAFATAWRLLPGQWDLNESLPMHLCRWNGWIVALCLINGHKGGWRWARSLAFFWGLGLSVQGMITPMWTFGAASVEFWLYWVGHLQIVGVAVYDLVVRRYTPAWPDLRLSMLAGVLYALFTGTLNKLLGTNYSYLGEWDYERASVVDRLGDYPERMLAMGGGALVLFVMMYFAARGARSLWSRRSAVPA